MVLGTVLLPAISILTAVIELKGVFPIPFFSLPLSVPSTVCCLSDFWGKKGPFNILVLASNNGYKFLIYWYSSL